MSFPHESPWAILDPSLKRINHVHPDQNKQAYNDLPVKNKKLPEFNPKQAGKIISPSVKAKAQKSIPIRKQEPLKTGVPLFISSALKNIQPTESTKVPVNTAKSEQESGLNNSTENISKHVSKIEFTAAQKDISQKFPELVQRDNALSLLTNPNSKIKEVLHDTMDVQLNKLPNTERALVVNTNNTQTNESKNIPKSIPEITMLDSKQNTAIQRNDKVQVVLERCSKNVAEIENELLYYKDSIYSEKLKALEAEIASIENGVHPVFVEKNKQAKRKFEKELARIESMYNYRIETIEALYAEQEQAINADIERQIGYAHKILRSEFPKNQRHNLKEASSRKIHLKQKVSKLESVHERQSKSGSNMLKPTIDKEDPLDDYFLLQKEIEAKQKNSTD